MDHEGLKASSPMSVPLVVRLLLHLRMGRGARFGLWPGLQRPLGSLLLVVLPVLVGVGPRLVVELLRAVLLLPARVGPVLVVERLRTVLRLRNPVIGVGMVELHLPAALLRLVVRPVCLV